MLKEKKATEIKQHHFAAGKYLRSRMEQWLLRTLPECNEKFAALEVIAKAKSGKSFIKAVHTECGQAVSSIVAQNCGSWATDLIDNLSEADHAKSLLLAMVFGEYKGEVDWKGKTRLFDPIVYAATRGFSTFNLEVDASVDFDTADTEVRFVPPHDLWTTADNLAKSWNESHKALKAVVYSSIDELIKDSLYEEKELHDALIGMMFTTKQGKKGVRYTIKIPFAYADWDVLNNRIQISTE